MSRVNLADERLGAVVVAANDEFFAPKERLVLASDPVWREDEYTDRGKWMDGWETRRRRSPGSDWCVIRLGAPGSVDGFVVDTTHFSGNHPEACTIEGADTDADPRESDWFHLVGPIGLEGNTPNPIEIPPSSRVSHLRLTIHPDGGVARLRAFGTVLPDWVSELEEQPVLDLASARLGALVIAASDAHFSNADNLLRVGPSQGMFDGWETARRRGAGHDWVDVALALPGRPQMVLVDTTHFKGNAPGSVRVTARDASDGSTVEVVPMQPVEPDTLNEFEISGPVPFVDQVRLEIHPDGGVARFRVVGRPDRSAVGGRMLALLNALAEPAAFARFGSCCGSRAWAKAMATRRPYANPEALLATASEAFGSLDPNDWEEAFAAHPRIGEGGGDQDARGQSWSRGEQSGVADGDVPVLEALADLNRIYEEQFGRTYIVSAAGRSAEELLSVLQDRLENAPDVELHAAAAGQAKITAQRLQKLLGIEEV